MPAAAASRIDPGTSKADNRSRAGTGIYRRVARRFPVAPGSGTGTLFADTGPGLAGEPPK
ncbi:MAG: hypothetical protein LBQ12_13205 [Deltaproteobacteria bacterium]|nr:hypothetical protein [Deltaproteobacteria bacterium]